MSSSDPLPTSKALETTPGPPSTNGSTNGAASLSHDGSDEEPKVPVPSAKALLFGTFPTLDDAPVSRYIQSFLLLAVALAFMATGAKYMGLEIFQTKVQQGLIVGGVIFGLFFSGVVWIDFWHLVIGWWYINIPLVIGTGIVFVMMQESSEEIADID